LQSIAADKNKFYSLDAFKNSLTEDYAVNGYTVNGIKTLMDARKTYLSGLSTFTELQPSFSDRSHDYTTNQPVVTVKVNDANNDNVFIYYRVHGDGNNAFKSLKMTKINDIYTVTLPNSTGVLEYYFYAENDNAGTFFPAHAAHVFYTMNAGEIFTGIEQNNVSQIKIYPNPAFNVVTVSGCEVNEVITVYNIVGSVVYQTISTGKQCTIPVENWANGIYMLRTGKYSCKITVKHIK